jgi:O-antigen/teichoic acid export membrane protein
MLVAQSVSQVFFQRAAEKKAAGEDLGQLVEQVCVRLTGLMTLPLLMVAITGPAMFAVLFGIKWTEAGLYAALLVPYMFATLIASPLLNLFDVLERQGTSFLFNVLFLVSRVISLVLGAILLRDVKSALLLFSVVSALGYAWRAHYILSAVGVPFTRIVVSLRPYLVNAALPIALMAAARWWVHLGSVYLLAVALAVSAPCYIYLLRQDTHVRQAFLRLMTRIGVSQ